METREILEFFFGNFWHWLGAFLMLTILIAGIAVMSNFRLVSVSHKTKNVFVRREDKKDEKNPE